MESLSRGLFISVEGVDGSGKSTLCAALQSHYGALYPGRYVATREPGGNGLPVCEKIRELVLSEPSASLTPQAEAALFAASRAEHAAKLIWPALRQGKIVLSDRYIDSSVAYQGAARGLGVDWVRQLNLAVTDNLMPDLTLLLFLGEKQAGDRAERRDKRHFNHLDRLPPTFHEKVNRQFRMIAEREPKRVLVLDAGLSPDDVLQTAIGRIDQLLKERL